MRATVTAGMVTEFRLCGAGRRKAMVPVAIIASLLTGGLVSGTARAQSGQAWTPHRDARLGFTVQCPAGWSVSTSGTTIVMRSADRASLVVAEAFVAPREDDAADRLRKIIGNRASLFPKARVDRVENRNVGDGEQAVGSLSFSAANGKPATGRVLCSVFRRSGMLYAIGSPADQFSRQRPTLIRVLQSLKFTTPQGAPRTARATGTAAPAIAFTRWTDPKEGAFHVDVPKGWKIDGGAFRMGAVDVRMCVQATSPQKDVSIVIGDPSITTFAEMSPMYANLGMREGSPYNPGTQMTLYHYMPALEFNRWYLNSHLSRVIGDIEVKKEQEVPQLARQLNDAAMRGAGGMAQYVTTVGQTEFTGTSKLLGKPITGVVVSITMRVRTAGADSGLWYATPMTAGFTAEKRPVATAVFARMVRSYQTDPHWGTQQANTAGAVSKITSDTNAAISKTISDTYWKNDAVQSEASRNWSNATLGLTDVKDEATGETWKVASGHNYYWRNAGTGDIAGTDTFDRPNTDFTPLTEW